MGIFDPDKWVEILETMRKNKLRTILTGLSVMWGILMLILLLGFGQGLINGFLHEFNDDAINSIWISGGQTSIPHDGLQPGRRIQFTNDDYDYIQENILQPGEHMTGRYARWGNNLATYGAMSNSYSIRSVHPGHQYLEKTIMIKGRYLNDMDLDETRKVVVIGNVVEEELFDGDEPVGKYMNINGIAYKVVGVFKDEGSENEARMLYIPITTGQRVFNEPTRVHQMMLTVGDATVGESLMIADKIRTILANRHNFSINDPRAVRVRSNIEEYEEVMSILTGIRMFVWVISIMTIIAGVVGVGNIMLILVKERTREIGIRKALGATPWSIISMVLVEAVFVTGFFGYLGLLIGVGLLETMNFVMVNYNLDIGIIRQPEIQVKIALQAIALLIIAGSLAGLFPSLQAARIRPIVALRDE